MRICLQSALVFFVASVSFAQQPPQATKEHEVLQKDVGTWTGTMTFYQGGSKLTALPIQETNTLFANGLWLLSEFDAGPFQGRGQFGYDAQKKKYVGTWIDNSTPFLNIMEGDFDAEKQEMVMEFKATDAVTGNIEQMKSVSTMDGSEKRKFVMYTRKDGDWIKSFEIDYQRTK